MAAKQTIHPVILSGGAGTRLWPLSRALYPKQLMPLVGDHSLLRETAARVSDPSRFAAPVVVCNDEHRFMVAGQLQENDPPPRRVLLEPTARNTAPAVCAAALMLAAEDPDAVMLLLPSDHHIARGEVFLHAVDRAAVAAEAGWLVTFGITPSRAETGYGYIAQGPALTDCPGCHRVARFVEKPDAATAAAYLAGGDYAWNSGMFLFRAARLIEEMQRFEPQILEACRAALDRAVADLDFLRLDAEAFTASPAISIDYAVMERTDRAAVVPADIGWSDIGSWDSLCDVAEQDAEGNCRRGDILAVDCRNSYLQSDGQLIATLGLEDMVVVATRDAVLVAPRDRSQEIRELVNRLEAAGRSEHLLHARVHRPWGSYEGIDADKGFQVKRLILHPGASISLQRHKHRAEHWVVVRGTAEVTRDEEVFTLQERQSADIPLGAVHRLRNPGDTPLHIIEVQSGDYLGEDDIERFEDVYGRVEES